MVYLKDSKIKVEGSREVARVFLDLLLLEDEIDQQKEHFYCLHLDVRNRVNMVELVSLGTLTASLVHPRRSDAQCGRAAPQSLSRITIPRVSLSPQMRI
jgi:RadC-like JAB domain